ncbi:MAG: hypothetical protein M3Q30_23255 [Actinomycetota bacterium]|nr:hypothetical protein [Actinomycetota bacterium]
MSTAQAQYLAAVLWYRNSPKGRQEALRRSIANREGGNPLRTLTDLNAAGRPVRLVDVSALDGADVIGELGGPPPNPNREPS